ncbi:MAG: prephenate dehydrogenase/arogenate dehydrogenase family protein, partial [Candidatus Thorarchaeota archaeon]
MRIAIIGGAGNMGRLLVTHFLRHNHSLVVSDPRTGEVLSGDFDIATSNVAAVKDADLALISVPMEKTAAVIREVAPHMKENSILCEITTLKSNILETLRSACGHKLRPLCIHPLFGPRASYLRKKFALIPVMDEEEEKKLANSLFPESQIVIVEAGEHDRIMALTLTLPYFINMVLASILKDENISLIE